MNKLESTLKDREKVLKTLQTDKKILSKLKVEQDKEINNLIGDPEYINHVVNLDNVIVKSLKRLSTINRKLSN